MRNSLFLLRLLGKFNKKYFPINETAINLSEMGDQKSKILTFNCHFQLSKSGNYFETEISLLKIFKK